MAEENPNVERSSQNDARDQGGENQADTDDTAGRDVLSLLVIQTPSSVVEQEFSIPTLNEELDSMTRNAASSATNEHDRQSQHGEENLGDIAAESPDHAIQHIASTDLLTIRLKFLDDTQKVVQAQKDQTVGLFKRQHFAQHLTAGKIVRLIFQGRLLRDDLSTLSSYGLHDQCIVHCHIGTRPYSSPAAGENAENSMLNQNGAAVNQFAARLATPGSWLDCLFFYAWSLLMIAWEWSNRVEEVPAEGHSFLARVKERFRHCLQIFIDILFGSFIRASNATQRRRNSGGGEEDDVRYNVGHLLVLLVFVKFLLLWSFVLLYPQFTDRRSIFLLIILTTTTAFYFYFNRANIAQTQRAAAAAAHSE